MSSSINHHGTTGEKQHRPSQFVQSQEELELRGGIFAKKKSKKNIGLQDIFTLTSGRGVLGRGQQGDSIRANGDLRSGASARGAKENARSSTLK